MGGEPLFTMLLLGLGVRQLSMPPHQLPEIKRIIRGIRMEDAHAVTAEALLLETSEAVTSLLQNALRRALPDTPPTVACDLGGPPRRP
jgi:phosphotransferase system enzyme I (PtsI)